MNEGVAERRRKEECWGGRDNEWSSLLTGTAESVEIRAGSCTGQLEGYSNIPRAVGWSEWRTSKLDAYRMRVKKWRLSTDNCFKFM